MTSVDGFRLSRRQGWLLTLGVALLAVLVSAHGVGAISDIVVQARYRVVVVIAAHLPVILLATLGWQALLPREGRPALGFLLRLRLIKESINALLPVAQVGGDVVRARLAVRNGLTLAETTASCVVDVIAGTLGLVVFVVMGLALALATQRNPQFVRLGLYLLAATAAVALVIGLCRWLGLADRLGRLVDRWRSSLGRLADFGAALRRQSGQRAEFVASLLWHMAAWGWGSVETFAAMWAIGLHPTLVQVLILESLAQAVKGLGFAIPGALGVQEGGYILLGGALGVSADQALALSLLRRLREMTLGAVGLIVWRATESANRRRTARG